MSTITKFFVSAALAAFAFVAFASTASAAYTYTGLLKMGMTSPQVKVLQQTLNSDGFLVSTTGAGSLGLESSYFGPKTKAAVMSFQSAKGIEADGIVGLQTGTALAAMSGSPVVSTGCTSTSGFNPITGASCAQVSTNLPAGCTSTGGFSPLTGVSCASVSATLPAGCTSTGGFSPVTGVSCASGSTNTNTGLSGGAGNISSTTLMGSPSNVQVGEGSTGTAILGFQVRADAGSSLNIQNIRVNLVATGTGSTWPSRYISGISVWQGTNKVGSISVANLSQSGTTYNATIPLSGAIVAANSTSNFAISVDANSSIDSSDAGNTFAVFVDSIRYGDATGAILTSSGLATSTTGIMQPMRFLKLSASASTKLTLSEDAANPRDRTVTTNYTSTTNDVSLLKFNLSAAGSDMILTKIALPVTATGTNNASDISAYYKLKYNGNVVSSFSLTLAGLTPVITFGDTTVAGSTPLNGGIGQIVIPAGSRGAFEVVADVKAMNTGTGSATTFDAGDTLKVNYPSTALNNTGPGLTTVQDQTGASLGTSSTNRTGSATGYTATFRVQGVTSTYGGNTFTPTKNTSGVLTSEAYTTTITVAATGNDFFINPVANFVPNTTLSTTQDGVANTAFGFNVAVLNSSNQYVTTTEVTAASVALSVTCTSGCIQQSLTSMKIPANTTATFVVSATLTDNQTTSSILPGGYKVAIFSTNASDGTTLAAYPNTPSYNFITPVSPDNFQ